MNTHRLTRPIAAVFLGTAAMLSLPLVGMRLGDGVAWTGADFAIAGVLLSSTGIAYVLASRLAGSSVSRWACGVALGTALLLVWANLAVGLIGSESDPANLMYIGVLAVGLAGVFIAGFEPRRMARALVGTAVAQGVVAAIALLAGLGEPLSGPAEIVLTNGLFVGLWLTAAVLFRAAARGNSAGTRARDPMEH